MSIVTKNFQWGDGSGDKITVTYDNAGKSQVIDVKSDQNLTKVSRSKILTIKTTIGSPIRTAVLSVNQDPYPGDFNDDFNNDFYT